MRARKNATPAAAKKTTAKKTASKKAAEPPHYATFGEAMKAKAKGTIPRGAKFKKNSLGEFQLVDAKGNYLSASFAAADVGAWYLGRDKFKVEG